jgi:hypothetical protein
MIEPQQLNAEVKEFSESVLFEAGDFLRMTEFGDPTSGINFPPNA